METNTTDTVVEINNLSYKVGTRYILKDINWSVKRGEHWVIFGMNGSGKTTLLSIIAGFQHYTDGSVKISGLDYIDPAVKGAHKKIGFVSSSFFDKFYTKESVLDVVLSGKFGTLGLGEDILLKDIKLAKKLLTNLHMEEKVCKTYNMLSKGEKQSVLFARALMIQPEILLLDEPFNGLDVYNRVCLQKMITDLAMNKKLSILYVTHYAEEIDLSVFDKAILLANGRIYAKGAFDKLISTNKMNYLIGHNIKVFNENNMLHFDLRNVH